MSAGLPTSVMQGSNTLSVPSTLFKGTTQITSETEVGPGETLLWNPPAKVFGTEINAFTVKVSDGEKFSEDDPNTDGNEAVVTIKVNVDRVNRVPVINTTPVLAGVDGDRASEDTFYEITVEQLLAATNASDPDLNDTIRFKLSPTQTIPLQGTLQFEQSPNNWVAVSPANGDILGAGFAVKWRWKGPALAHGAIQAFGIQPFDGDAATGLNPVSTPVTVKVDSVNNLPVLGKGSPAAIDEIQGAVEDKIFAVSYESLFAASYAAGVQPDLDGDVVKFRYKSSGPRTGVLLKRGMSAAVVDGDLLAPGETWHWQAPQNENRVTNNNLPHKAFTVAAFDGTAESVITLPVRVSVTEINDIPTVGAVLKLDPPAEKNQAAGYSITYAMLKAAVPVSDVETANLDNIEYRIESVGAGTLRLGQFNSGPVVTTGMPMLKSVGGDLNTSASALNWTPPLNAFGQTFLVMTVRPFDGTDYAAESYEVKIDVTGSNAVPTLNSGFTLGSSSNRAEGTSQNTPIVISYETLLARGNVQDTDLSTIFLQITSVENGKVVLGGNEFPVGTYPEGNAQNTLRLSPGEKLTWFPAAEARGEDGAALSAFRFKAYDNVAVSAGTGSLVKVNVMAVNQAPILNATALFTNAERNKEYTISFSDLADALNLRDVEDINSATSLTATPTKYDAVRLKVTEILSGQSLKIGATSGSALPLGIGNDTVQQGRSIFWRPPFNGALTYDAFIVQVIDSQGRPSATTGRVMITVTGDNVAPKLTSVSLKFDDPAKTIQDTPFVITFNAMDSALGITDEDSAVKSFVVTSINNGKLMVGSKQLTANTTPNLTPPNTTQLFNLNETMVYIPTQFLHGDDVTIMRVRAWDGFLASNEEAEVKIKLVRKNQIPELTSVQSLSGATQNIPYQFTYTNLRDKTDARDHEEPLPTKTLRFQVKSVNSGVLKRASNPNANPLVYDETLGADSPIDVADKLAWTPTENANGLLNAFSIVALDSDGATSQQPIPVFINTSAVNNLPVFTTGTGLVSGAREDIPFVISYQMLKDAYPGTDVESGETLTYQITALGSGSLVKGGTPVTVPAFVFPGESVTWTPPANQNFTQNGLLTAFSIRLRDTNPVTAGLSTDTKPVEVQVASVADQPAFTNAATVAQLPSNASKNNDDFQYVISFNDIKGVLPVSDVENGNDDIAYIVESVNSGTLRLGNTSSGTDVTSIAAPNKAVLVSANPGANETTNLHWTPPKNATGPFLVMTVRARDKDGELTASTRDVRVQVSGNNYQPTNNAAFTFGLTTAKSGSVPAGTSQNVPLLITYNTLLDSTFAADRDETPLFFRIKELKSGTLKVGNQTFVASATPFDPPLLVSAGESIVWTPDAQQYGEGLQALDAFIVRAFDNLQESQTDCLVKVSVAPINQPPALLAQNVTPKAGLRNAGLSTVPALATPVGTRVSFLDLAQDLGVTDPDKDDIDTTQSDLGVRYSKIRFRIEQIPSGQALLKGTDQNGAGAVAVSSQDIVGPGEFLFWRPPANKTGVFTAFTVTALDRSGNAAPIASRASANVGAYRIDVQGENIRPVIGNTAATLGNARENEPYTISYIALKNAVQLAVDPDSPTTQFVITDVQNGVLKKNGAAITPFTSINAGAPAGSVLAENEDMVFIPNQFANNTGGDPVIFSVRAFDGTVDANSTGYSAEQATIRLTLAAVNQNPQMSVAPAFNTCPKFYDKSLATPVVDNNKILPEDFSCEFTYAQLAALTNASDVEAGQGTQSIVFRVKSKVSGSLERLVSGVFATVDANQDIQAGDVIRWTPDVDSNGTLTAFTVVARDSLGGESDIALPVNVSVNSVNDLPLFAANSPALSASAFEDTAFVITHQMLTNAFPATDSAKEAGVLRYAIVAAPGSNAGFPANNSSFSKAGVTADPLLLAASPVVVGAGESVVWQPPANISGPVEAFEIKVLDADSGLSLDSRRVSVNVLAVNDQPVIAAKAKYLLQSFDSSPTLACSDSASTPPCDKDAAQNTAFIFRYKDIQKAIPVSDVETQNLDSIQYIIESVNAGTLRLGSAESSLNAAGQATRPRIVAIDSDALPTTTDILRWEPPRNALGEFTVMMVRAVDSQNPEAMSAQAVPVVVKISGNNQKPTITASVQLGTQNSGATKQNVPLYIEYSTLLSATAAQDADDQPVFFRFTELTEGTLTVGNNVYLPNTPLIPVPVVGPGERFIWKPADEMHSQKTNPAAARAAFKVVATDNVADAQASTPVAGLSTSPVSSIGIWVDRVNQAPKINALTTLSTSAGGGLVANATTALGEKLNERNRDFEIPFDTLVSKLGFTDVEDTVGNTGGVTFRIENLISGQSLKIGTSAFSASNNILAANQNLYWRPVENGTGTYDAFRVTAIDSGGLASANSALVRVTVTGINELPTVVPNASVLAGVSAVQYAPFTITYDEALRAKYGINDVDSPLRSLVITNITSGWIIRKGTITLSAFPDADSQQSPGTAPPVSVIAPFETITVIPTTALSETESKGDRNIFTFRAYDGEGYSTLASEATVAVNIVGFNQPPTLNASVTSTSFATTASKTAQRNANSPNEPDYFVSFEDLAEALDLKDAEDVPAPSPDAKFARMEIQINQIVGGQGMRIGGAASTWNSNSVEVNTGDTTTNVLRPTQRLFWRPPTNFTGTIDAFTVTAIDKGTDGIAKTSLTTGLVRIAVDNVKYRPLITVPNPTAFVKNENEGFTITYEQLKSTLGAQDRDSDSWFQFVVYAVSDGVLRKGAQTIVPYTGTGQPPDQAVVSPNETLTFIPTANVNQTKTIFSVRAFDGEQYSSDSAAAGVTTANPVGIPQSHEIGNVRVTFTPVNSIPTLTRVNTLEGTTAGSFATNEDTSLEVSHATLLALTDASDIEDARSTLRFRIKSVGSGTKVDQVNGASIVRTNCSSNCNMTVGDTINPNESFVWTPAKDQSGKLEAFRIVAVDNNTPSAAESIVSIPFIVNVAPVNDAPVRISANTGVLSGAIEDVPFNISYNMMLAAYPATDVESEPIRYKIVGLGDGELFKGAKKLGSSDFTTGVYLEPGEFLTFKPNLNLNSGNPSCTGGQCAAFTFRYADFNDAFATVDEAGLAVANPVPANVLIAAQNDVPKFKTSSAILANNVLQNQQSPEYKITWEHLKSVLLDSTLANADIDATSFDALSFRVESVSSGQLLLGGVDVNNLPIETNPNLPAELVNAPKRARILSPNRIPFLQLLENEATELTWIPPLNAIGQMPVMVVRVFDGADFSVSTATVRVNVVGANAKPLLGKTTLRLGVDENTTGTFQNSATFISYETLLQQTAATDPDQTPVSFRFADVKSGTLTVANIEYNSLSPKVNGELSPAPVVGPGERFSWRPDSVAPNNLGEPDAFEIRSFDGIVASDAKALVKVSITPVNQPPTLLSVLVFAKPYLANPPVNDLCQADSTKDGAVARNAVFFVQVKCLMQALDVRDAENNATGSLASYGQMKLRIEDVLSGQAVRIGNSSSVGAATLLNNSNRVVTENQYIFWTPPANTVGTFQAFRVSAIDSQQVTSANLGTVSIQVFNSTERPQLTSATLTKTLTGTAANPAVENKAFQISYDDLRNSFGISDADSSLVQFVVTCMNTGTVQNSTDAVVAVDSVRKGGAVMAPLNTANNCALSETQIAALPAGTNPSPNVLVAPNEIITVQPKLNINGERELFQVRAYDGSTYSTQVGIVKLNLAPVNQPPTLLTAASYTVADGTDATSTPPRGTDANGVTRNSFVQRNQLLEITYENLAAKLQITDVEDGTNAAAMKFQIQGMLSGQSLRIGPSTAVGQSSADNQAVAFASDNIDFGPGSSVFWQPPTNLSGTFDVMNVTVVDSQLMPSNFTAKVSVEVSGGNLPPTMSTLTPPSICTVPPPRSTGQCNSIKTVT